MGIKCQKVFTDDEVRYFIKDEQIWEKYVKFKNNQITHMKVSKMGKNYVNCPYPDCEEIMIVDHSILDDFCLECENGHQFCARCKNLGWHRIEECKKVKKIIN